MFEQFFNNYDSSYVECYHAAWSTYEEYGWIFVFKKENKYYSIRDGHCVYVPGSGDDLLDFKESLDGPLSEDEIWDIITEWNDVEKEW